VVGRTWVGQSGMSRCAENVGGKGTQAISAWVLLVLFIIKLVATDEDSAEPETDLASDPNVEMSAREEYLWCMQNCWDTGAACNRGVIANSSAVTNATVAANIPIPAANTTALGQDSTANALGCVTDFDNCKQHCQQVGDEELSEA